VAEDPRGFSRKARYVMRRDGRQLLATERQTQLTGLKHPLEDKRGDDRVFEEYRGLDIYDGKP